MLPHHAPHAEQVDHPPQPKTTESDQEDQGEPDAAHVGVVYPAGQQQPERQRRRLLLAPKFLGKRQLRALVHACEFAQDGIGDLFLNRFRYISTSYEKTDRSK